MPEALDQAIRRALCVCFPPDVDVFSRTRAWHGSGPAYSAVLLDADGEPVAHAGVVDRTIDAGGEGLRVAGIQNVYVLPVWRGRDLSNQVLAAAMQEAAARGFDAGLLFCVPELARVYVPGGWKPLPETPVTRIDATGAEVPIPGKNVVMFYPLRVKTFPRGPIHLRGNDW